MVSLAMYNACKMIVEEIEPNDRQGLRETPGRMAKSIRDLTVGYQVDIKALFKTFEDGAKNYNEFVVVRDIPVWSLCEHHVLPFFGTATIGYIPVERVLGLSKFARVVDAFARRLQVQERLTTQIADAIELHLKPKTVGVVVNCRHLCMEMRGVRCGNANTITSALRGHMMVDQACRAEFFRLVG